MAEDYQVAKDSSNVGLQPTEKTLIPRTKLSSTPSTARRKSTTTKITRTADASASGWQTAGRAATKVANGVVKTSWMIGGVAWALVGLASLILASGAAKLVGLVLIAYAIWLIVGAVRGGWRILIW
jgi:hypothetical protein